MTLNCLTLGSCKMSLFPKKVEYPFKVIYEFIHSPKLLLGTLLYLVTVGAILVLIVMFKKPTHKTKNILFYVL